MKKGKRKLNSRGLSAIVVNLILVLLGMVAIGVVWAVVNNLLQSGTEQTTTGFEQLSLNFEMQKVLVEPDGDLQVVVKRNVGSGTVSGLKFIISDGTNSKLISREAILDELESQSFIINYSEISDLSFVKEVSIAPIVGSDYTKGTTGNVLDSEEFSTKEIIENLGAVSWWRLDGDAQDEIGNNPGTINGSVQFVEGKYGKTGNFSGGYIVCGNNSNLNGKNGFTYSIWVRRLFGNSTHGGSVSQWPYLISHGSAHYYYSLMTNSYGANVYFEYGVPTYTGTFANLGVSSSLPINEWHHFVITYNGSVIKFYKDSSLVVSKSGVVLNPNFDRVYIGNSFSGQIDEAMIFNKALTAEQVKALYEMDLEIN